MDIPASYPLHGPERKTSLLPFSVSQTKTALFVTIRLPVLDKEWMGLMGQVEENILYFWAFSDRDNKAVVNTPEGVFRSQEQLRLYFEIPLPCKPARDVRITGYNDRAVVCVELENSDALQ